MTTKQYSRRKFLNHLGWLATLASFGGLTAASVRFMFPNVLYEPPKAYKIGEPQDYLDGVNYISEKRIFVIRKGNLFKVVSAVCTHIGCTVRWEADHSQWGCPCHGSIFNDRGAVVAYQTGIQPGDLLKISKKSEGILGPRTGLQLTRSPGPILTSHKVEDLVRNWGCGPFKGVVPCHINPN